MWFACVSEDEVFVGTVNVIPESLVVLVGALQIDCNGAHAPAATKLNAVVFDPVGYRTNCGNVAVGCSVQFVKAKGPLPGNDTGVGTNCTVSGSTEGADAEPDVNCTICVGAGARCN